MSACCCRTTVAIFLTQKCVCLETCLQADILSLEMLRCLTHTLKSVLESWSWRVGGACARPAPWEGPCKCVCVCPGAIFWRCPRGQSCARQLVGRPMRSSCTDTANAHANGTTRASWMVVARETRLQSCRLVGGTRTISASQPAKWRRANTNLFSRSFNILPARGRVKLLSYIIFAPTVFSSKYKLIITYVHVPIESFHKFSREHPRYQPPTSTTSLFVRNISKRFIQVQGYYHSYGIINNKHTIDPTNRFFTTKLAACPNHTGLGPSTSINHHFSAKLDVVSSEIPNGWVIVRFVSSN